jgi:23S rRNA pseudouridine1911/1915/1917 synthase
MQEYNLKISHQDSGRRLDLLLMDSSELKNLGFSRTFIQKLIREGKITIEGLRVKSHYKVKKDEELKIIVEDKKADIFQPEDIPLDIVYEDQDLAVINKPSGLVVHPAPGNYAHTLVNILLYHFQKLSDINPGRPGIVHRLDKDTSGLLVVAKNNPAHLGLAQQFSEHSIKRKYIAIVKGVMEFDEHIIELPIGRHLYRRENMAVRFGKNTKYAKTYYRTLKRGQDFSLLELVPFTGRTHQLRVHMAFLHHPILGDPKYGENNRFIRLALHAKYIGFIHPRTGEFIEFESDMPKEFRDFINAAAP